MIISYKKTISIIAVSQLFIIASMGYFVRQRIEQRQVTLQLFLQTQIDVDRQMIVQRDILRDTLTKARSYLLSANSDIERKLILGSIKEDLEKFNKFWVKYRDNYSGRHRPILQKVLSQSQELNLIEEESDLVDGIDRETKVYLSYLLSYLPVSIGNESKFLDELNKRRQNVFVFLNNLTDVRYIFSQRVVFFISDENDRQQGLFTSIFIFLFFSSLVLFILEYLFIHKPIKDILLFLQEASRGKNGQRLYFSSIVKEIKESEDVINKFIDKVEEHEKER